MESVDGGVGVGVVDGGGGRKERVAGAVERVREGMRWGRRGPKVWVGGTSVGGVEMALVRVRGCFERG